MHKVASYALKKGWPMPEPKNPLDMLARDFSRAARQEIRQDKVTGKPYRANHALHVEKFKVSQYRPVTLMAL